MSFNLIAVVTVHMILEPKKINSVTVSHFFTFYFVSDSFQPHGL